MLLDYFISDGFIITMTSLWARWRLKAPGTDQGKHQSSTSLAFVQRIHRWPVNSPHKGTVTRKMFSFDDVIMCSFVKNVDLQAFVQDYKCLYIEYDCAFHVTTSDSFRNYYQRYHPCSVLSQVLCQTAICQSVLWYAKYHNLFIGRCCLDYTAKVYDIS